VHYNNLFTCQDAIEFGRRMGWDKFCLVGEYGRGDLKKNVGAGSQTRPDVITGVLVTSDVAKNAKKALDLADIVLVDGRTEDAAREASESWDIDLIVNAELGQERDLIRQRSSGLDHVIASFMSQRNIGYCVNVDNIIHASGARRSQLLGRVIQNIMISRKYDVKVVLSCGQVSRWDLRNPHALMAVGRCLGLNLSESRDTVSKNPDYFIKKAAARNNPDIITEGVEVKSWGKQDRKPNRKHGWY
jgi:RNase P/RNase MRP subunit p30